MYFNTITTVEEIFIGSNLIESTLHCLDKSIIIIYGSRQNGSMQCPHTNRFIAGIDTRSWEGLPSSRVQKVCDNALSYMSYTLRNISHFA